MNNKVYVVEELRLVSQGLEGEGYVTGDSVTDSGLKSEKRKQKFFGVARPRRVEGCFTKEPKTAFYGKIPHCHSPNQKKSTPT